MQFSISTDASQLHMRGVPESVALEMRARYVSLPDLPDLPDVLLTMISEPINC
jgi:hypothetical protein